ncbi:hypothetical protein SDC9_201062 [bioreactor metagenome]|uniref:Uncharacterized protein n=1 Tax=bioreactor metagenome TaxID=1076179 RepID=A0A645IPW8_9ZZZZ
MVEIKQLSTGGIVIETVDGEIPALCILVDGTEHIIVPVHCFLAASEGGNL